jgi:hypothetical protein
MLNVLLDNIAEKGNLNFVTYSEYVAVKNYPVTSRRYINFINKITGLHLTPESMSRLISENSRDEKNRTVEDRIKDFVHTYVRELSNLKTDLLYNKVSDISYNKEYLIKDLQSFINNNIVFNPNYIAFSDIIVKNNYDNVMKVLDLKGNQ